MTRLRAIATGVAALLALALITVGVPVLLARIGAIPTAIPDPSTVWQALITPDRSGRAVFVVLAALTWTCWGTFTASVVREVAAAIHSRGRRPAPPVRGLGWSARPAAVLVGAVVAMIMAAPVATMTAPPAAAAPTPAAAMHAVPAAPSPTPPGEPAADTTTAQQPATTSATAPAPAPKRRCRGPARTRWRGTTRCGRSPPGSWGSRGGGWRSSTSTRRSARTTSSTPDRC